MTELKDYEEKSTIPTIVVPRMLRPMGKCVLCGKNFGRFKWSKEHDNWICEKECD